MDLQVKKEDRNGEEKIEDFSVESFTYAQLLHDQDNDEIRLEQQPKTVCLALGRLLDKLMEKNVLNLEELHTVLDTSWWLRDKVTVVTHE